MAKKTQPVECLTGLTNSQLHIELEKYQKTLSVYQDNQTAASVVRAVKALIAAIEDELARPERHAWKAEYVQRIADFQTDLENIDPRSLFDELHRFQKIPIPWCADRTDPDRKEKMDLYRQGEALANATFRRKCEVRNGLVDHKKADKVWNLAWYGRECGGYNDILCHYDDLAELVRNR